MESRAFIREAKKLMQQMIAKPAADQATQSELTRLLQGMQNPTLPSVRRLVEMAQRYDYEVEGRVIHRLNEAEKAWEG